MSQNPYNSAGGFGDESDRYDSPPRTSLLAIFSVLCAIPCCIPGAGVVAATLGAVSLGFIRNARGRLTGRTAAIIGIFLGVLVTVIQVAVGIGVSQAWTYYAKTMAPVAETFFVSASQGDFAKARSTLASDAASTLSDDDIASFIRAVELQVGEVRSISTDFGFMMKSFERVYSGGSSPPQTNTQNMNVAPVPFALETSTGSAIIVAVYDISSAKSSSPVLADMLVLIPGVRAVALLPDGPARRQAAPAYGVTVLTPIEAIEDAEAKQAGPALPAPDADSESGAPIDEPDEQPL